MSILVAVKITILGSGTSTGIPVLGCPCPVCTSANPRNRRLRVSAYVDLGRHKVLIDCSPDFRRQALDNHIRQIDAVLFTHDHADHCHGLDDLRMVNYLQGYRDIPCWAPTASAERLLGRFGYAFGMSSYPGAPKLKLNPLEAGPFDCPGIGTVEAIPVPHGPAGTTFGYRIGRFAYVTDCNQVPPDARNRLRDLDVLVLDALRWKEHPTHMSIGQSLDVVTDVKPRLCVFTHMTHEVDHDSLQSKLPENVIVGYDGLTVETAG